jgi:hypothetical protein
MLRTLQPMIQDDGPVEHSGNEHAPAAREEPALSAFSRRRSSAVHLRENPADRAEVESKQQERVSSFALAIAQREERERARQVR